MRTKALLILTWVACASQTRGSEIQLGDLAVRLDEDHRFTLTIGGARFLHNDGGGVWHTWEEPPLMALVGKDTEVSVRETRGTKRLALETSKPGVGVFRREVVLLPDECLVKWELKLEGKYDQRLGELSVLVPQETVQGKPFEYVDEGGRQLCGRWGVQEAGRPVYGDVMWNHTHIPDHSDTLYGQLPKGFFVCPLKQLTFDFGGYFVRYDLTCEQAAEGDYHIAELQDTTEQTQAYRIRMGFIAKSPSWRFRAVLRVRVLKGRQPLLSLPAERGAFEEWTTQRDLLDLIDDGFALTLLRDHKWLFTGDRIRVRVDYLADEMTDRVVLAKYRLLDYYDRVVDQGKAPLVARGAARAENVLTFTPKQTGMYRLMVDYSGSSSRSRERQAIFAVLPRREAARGGSLFGAHLPLTEHYGALGAAAGVRWIRLWHTANTPYWAVVEPEKGKFLFDDRAINCARRHGLQMLGILEGAPKWAGKPDWTSGEFLSLWLEYVRETVSHYKGTIIHWEVLNEPGFGGFFREHPEAYVSLLRATYQTVKSVAPDAVVVGSNGPAGWGMDWFEKVFKLGGLNWQDAVSIHYASSACSAPDWDVRAMEDIDFIRNQMRRHGTVKPIWNTEDMVWLDGVFYRRSYPSSQRDVGVHDVSKIPPPVYREHCHRLIRLYLAHMARGVRVFYFQWFGGGWWHLNEGDHTPTPPVVAHSVLSSLLSGATYRQHLLGDRLQCHLLQRSNGEPIAVLYAYNLQERDRGQGTMDDEKGEVGERESGRKGDKGRLVLPIGAAKLKAMDIMGNERKLSGDAKVTVLALTEEPVYLVGDKVNLAQLTAALRRARVSGLKGASDDPWRCTFKPQLRKASLKSFARFFCVDLVPWCNRGFQDEVTGDGQGGWTDEGENDMRYLPPGEWTSQGVPFRILDPRTNDDRSCIVLKGEHAPHNPEAVRGIKIGRKVTALHFAHTATFAGGGRLAKYVVHYTAGESTEIPVEAGVNVADWYASASLPAAKVFWCGPNPSTTRVAVYQFAWPNPKPGLMLESIDFLSEGKGTPVLIAMTGEGQPSTFVRMKRDRNQKAR